RSATTPRSTMPLHHRFGGAHGARRGAVRHAQPHYNRHGRSGAGAGPAELIAKTWGAPSCCFTARLNRVQARLPSICLSARAGVTIESVVALALVAAAVGTMHSDVGSAFLRIRFWGLQSLPSQYKNTMIEAGRGKRQSNTRADWWLN